MQAVILNVYIIDFSRAMFPSISLLLFLYSTLYRRDSYVSLYLSPSILIQHSLQKRRLCFPVSLSFYSYTELSTEETANNKPPTRAPGSYVPPSVRKDQDNNNNRQRGMFGLGMYTDHFISVVECNITLTL